MKKDFLIFLCALSALFFIPVRTHATDYAIGDNNSTLSAVIPLVVSSGNYTAITQQIILAEDLGSSAGNITDITFFYGGKSNTTAVSSVTRTIEIWLSAVSSSFDEFDINSSTHKFYYVAPGTKVFDGSITTEAIAVGQVKQLPIDITNFAWNGSTNIVMTVFDKTDSKYGSDAGNLRFVLAATETARFVHINQTVAIDNAYSDFNDYKNDLAGKQGITFSSPLTDEGQRTSHHWVNRMILSVSSPIPAPGSPSVDNESITASSADIRWSAAAGADSYEVRWGTTPGSLGEPVNAGNNLSYSITGLEDGITYYFQVRTKIGSEYSAWTSEVSFNTVAIVHEHNGISFDKWASDNSFPTSGNYYLNSDIAFGWENIDVTLSGNLNLCLNGHTANLAFFRIIVPSGVTFTLFDNVGGGKITSIFAGSTGEMISEGLITVNNGGTLILGEGAIENTYVTDEDGVSIAICSQGTLKLSGAPSISSNDIDIYLGNNSNITIESGKPLTNSTPFKVSRLLSGKFTSGWTNMSGADPSDHFVSAKAGHGIGLSEGEAAFLAVLALDENSSSNESTLLPEVGQTHNVAITRSTLSSSQFNTFCLPFALSNAQLEEIFGAGFDLEEFVSSEIVGEELVLTFNPVDALEAGKPYLIQPSINVTNPSFEGVTISAAAPVDQTSDEFISFHGVFNPTELTGGNKNLLFLGAGNELFWPASTGNLKGFRAYFEVKGDARKAKAARIVKKEDQSQAIENVENPDRAQKRIVNGQLIIEKNGRFYNAQGQIVK